MSVHSSSSFRTTSGSRRIRRLLIVAVVALGLGAREARAQDTSTPIAAIDRQDAAPIADSIARLTQNPSVPTARQSSIARSPVLLGAAIGAGSVAAWHASECRGSACNTGIAALVGAGAGAYTGLIVSAAQSARAGRPVSRRVKLALVLGAVGAAAGGWLACYGAGGCGGTS